MREQLRPLALTIVPETAGLDEKGWQDLEAIVLEAVSERPPAMRRQLGLFVRVLQWLPVLRYGRPFTSLTPEQKESFLSAVQDAPVLALRRGFWGLRTLCLMGYYGRPAGAAETGWHPDPRGWEVRR